MSVYVVILADKWSVRPVVFLKLLAVAVMCLGYIACWGAQCFQLSPLKAV